ncbi:MAG: NADH-quinone oxidoreductase subunit NuoK [Verrucomicrobiota bacterium]
MNPLTDITLAHYLGLSAILFMIGVTGVLIRRNVLIIYMCLEMMLNAANLALVSFDRFQDTGGSGQILVFFIITVAAAEVAVGLALIVALYRKLQKTDIAQLAGLKF